MPQSIQAQAADEVLKRRKARKNTLDFVRYCMSGYKYGEHHKTICDRLDAIVRGELKRVIFMAPPRHGKSTLVSRYFPSYFMGKTQNRQVIISAYGQDLANDLGRDIRGIIDSDEYRKIFPGVTLNKDSHSMNRFHTSNGGVLFAVGVGAAVTGRGADLAVIDDPVKDRESADSESVRKAIHDWYTSTLYTRLMPDAALCIMMTRWHQDDLVGRLLDASRRSGEPWHVVELPAIQDEGTEDEKALWPEWFSLDALKKIKGEIGPRDWSALYQQRPSSEQGDFFKREWFKIYDREDLPRHLNFYITSDFAVTDGAGDFTVHMVFGVDHLFNIYVIDLWRAKTSPDVWIDALLALVKRYRPLKWFAESGVIKRAIEPMLQARQKELGIFAPAEYVTSVKAKDVRARGFQSRAAIGTVFVPSYQKWTDVVLDEITKFPSAKHDDIVDCCGLIGLAVNQMVSSILPDGSGAKIPLRDYGMADNSSEVSWRVI